VVEEAIALSLAGAPDAKVRLAVSLEPLLPPVLVDKIQIEQVLLNLIRNALDAMEDSPAREIAITTAPDETGFVRVSLADSGPGIAPEIAAKLFQPFVTSKEKGMGIGLTICQSIIEAHGGRIWAESGTGAVFHFRLPAASRP
jgi:two-component system sensor kinase FixL